MGRYRFGVNHRFVRWLGSTIPAGPFWVAGGGSQFYTVDHFSQFELVYALFTHIGYLHPELERAGLATVSHPLEAEKVGLAGLCATSQNSSPRFTGPVRNLEPDSLYTG